MLHVKFHIHIPECNSSATQDLHLCSPFPAHPPLTATLTHCSITHIQEDPRQSDPCATEDHYSNVRTEDHYSNVRTEDHYSNVHTTPRDTIGLAAMVEEV